MKTKTFKTAALCLTLMCCLVLLTMCKKEDDTVTPTTVSHRITGYNFYFNDTLEMKVNITYSGNLIAAIMATDAGGAEISKEELEYEGNSIKSVTEYEKSVDTWIKSFRYEVNGYTGDNPQEIVFRSYDASGIETYANKIIYGFEGTLLKHQDSYTFQNGTWGLYGITTYIYDTRGRILVEDETAFSWGHITTYTYSGELMTEALTQSKDYTSLTNSGKSTYEYVNNLLTKVTTYDWTEGGAWIKSSEEEFTYNVDGTLETEWLKFHDYGFSARIEFIYGEGSGNFRQYIKITGGGPVLPGDPTPYPVKSTGLTDKFPESIRKAFHLKFND